MPGGIAVGTLAIGKAGAKNAGLLAAQIVALNNVDIEQKIIEFRRKQTEAVWPTGPFRIVAQAPMR